MRTQRMLEIKVFKNLKSVSVYSVVFLIALFGLNIILKAYQKKTI